MLFIKRWRYRNLIGRTTKQGRVHLGDLAFQDDAACTYAVAAMMYLEHIGGGQVLIDAQGGLCNCGFAMSDYLLDTSRCLATHVNGEAYGPAFMVLISGGKGKRTAFVDANLGLGHIGRPASAPESEFERLRRELVVLLCRCSLVDATMAEQLITDETRLSANDALRLGFIDRVVDQPIG